MGDRTGIEWTGSTWNPVTGCTKISPGCDNCYAERMAERFRGTPAYPQGFDVTLRPERLDQPLRWQRPRMIFVNSMSDLFHEDVPDDFVFQCFDVMAKADRHTFQVLTKRAPRMRDLFHRWLGSGRWRRLVTPPNIWLGVSVESGRQKGRIGVLQTTKATLRFLSIEPLIGPLNFGPQHLERIGWVIVGGESGPGARPMDPAWVREIRDQCIAAGVPLFFKQWGGARPKSGGKELDGREWCEFPVARAA